MKPKMILKMITDIAMTAALLLLMTYELIGDKALIGVAMFVLFIFHHILNSHWSSNLHMISAYWGFVFISLRLRLHWNMMMGMAGKFMKKTSAVRTWVFGLLLC